MISSQMKKIFGIGLVPLIVIDDANDAVPLGRTLIKGGIPIAEVAMRTPSALDAIRVMSQEVGGLIVGAGTVHTVKQAEDCVKCGATFIVTPGLVPAVTEWCIKNCIDVIPGAVTPTEIEAAMGFGLSVCKFFPAEAYGGVNTLKSLHDPFIDMSFMPTGGVNYDNMNDYLALPNVAAVGGTFLAPRSMIKEENWAGIIATCQKALKNKKTKQA